MQRVMILLCCLMLGCKKTPQPTTSVNWLHGEWDWYLARNPWSTHHTPQNTGKNWQLKFNPDGLFTSSGTYSVAGTGYFRDTVPKLLMRYSHEPFDRRGYYSFKTRDSLELDFGSWVDAPIQYFVRKQ